MDGQYNSAAVGYIINVDKRFHTFVANRIAVIRERTCPLQWRYVNSACNLADDASRGVKIDDLIVTPDGSVDRIFYSMMKQGSPKNTSDNSRINVSD